MLMCLGNNSKRKKVCALIFMQFLPFAEKLEMFMKRDETRSSRVDTRFQVLIYSYSVNSLVTATPDTR